MPLENQIYGKIKSISLDAEGNINIWIGKESKVPTNVLIGMVQEFTDKDVIVTIQPLRRKEDGEYS